MRLIQYYSHTGSVKLSGMADISLEITLRFFRSVDNWGVVAQHIRNITENTDQSIRIFNGLEAFKSSTLTGRESCVIPMFVEGFKEKHVADLLQRYHPYLRALIDAKSASLHITWY